MISAQNFTVASSFDATGLIFAAINVRRRTDRIIELEILLFFVFDVIFCFPAFIVTCACEN